MGLFGMWLGVTPLGGLKHLMLPFLQDFDPQRVRFHLLSPHFPFKSLIRLLLRHIMVCRLTCTTLSPYHASGSWGTCCARHRAAYTVWRARAVDGSYGGDVEVKLLLNHKEIRGVLH